MDASETKRIEAIRNGDFKVFEQIFKEFYKPLCKYAYNILKDTDKANETVQDLFYNLWKKHENWQISTSLKSYLYRSVHNNCLLVIQHKQVEQKYEKHMAENGVFYEPDPSEELKYQELMEAVQRTLALLPEKCREVFKLSRFEGLKYNEIAEKLNISIKTVEVHMGKALRLFRENLKEYVSIIIAIILIRF